MCMRNYIVRFFHDAGRVLAVIKLCALLCPDALLWAGTESDFLYSLSFIFDFCMHMVCIGDVVLNV